MRRNLAHLVRESWTPIYPRAARRRARRVAEAEASNDPLGHLAAAIGAVIRSTSLSADEKREKVLRLCKLLDDDDAEGEGDIPGMSEEQPADEAYRPRRTGGKLTLESFLAGMARPYIPAKAKPAPSRGPARLTDISFDRFLREMRK